MENQREEDTRDFATVLGESLEPAPDRQLLRDQQDDGRRVPGASPTDGSGLVHGVGAERRGVGAAALPAGGSGAGLGASAGGLGWGAYGAEEEGGDAAVAVRGV